MKENQMYMIHRQTLGVILQGENAKLNKTLYRLSYQDTQMVCYLNAVNICEGINFDMHTL